MPQPTKPEETTGAGIPNLATPSTDNPADDLYNMPVPAENAGPDDDLPADALVEATSVQGASDDETATRQDVVNS